MTTDRKKQLKDMLSGWKNVFITDEEAEALAAERKLVCEECPHRKKFTCALCGCPLEAKWRAVEAECPDNRWER